MRSSIYQVRRYVGEDLYTCRGKKIGKVKRKVSKRKNGNCRKLTAEEIKAIYG